MDNERHSGVNRARQSIDWYFPIAEPACSQDMQGISVLALALASSISRYVEALLVRSW